VPIDELAAVLTTEDHPFDVDHATAVTGVTLRASDVHPGDLFAALPGARAHGADFAAEALARGAAAVLTDPEGARRLPPDAALPVLVHPRPRAVLGAVAAHVYGDPTADLGVIGITGTSGKTTVAHLVEAGLAAAGRTTGMLGTVGIRIDGRPLPSAFTTPEAPDLQALFAVMREAGVTDVVMEVSSHALALGRVAGTRFAGRRVHQPLAGPPGFPQRHGRVLRGQGHAVRRARRARRRLRRRHLGRPPRRPRAAAVTVATTGASADWRAADVGTDADGGQHFTALTPDGPVPVRLQLPGSFNVANALVALASLAAVGVPAGPRGGAVRRGRGARPDAADRRGPAVPRGGRLRAQARRRRRPARHAARPGARAADHRAGLRR
jgi:UDP-N-acetylmuramoyl-L-alanyl-D-glutamate--2,6-diaminopimelate ligase